MTAPIRVGFQGAAGAFSEQALIKAAGRTIEPEGLDSFEDVGRAVVDGDIRYGFLPLENTLAGSVTPSYDVLASQPLRVLAEVVMPIRHCLLGTSGARLDEIYRVISHQVALSQCRRFLGSNPAVQAVAFFDTAGAAAQVARTKDPATAAIAPYACAKRYGLDVLAEGIEDRRDNATRFVFVTREDDPEPFDLVRGAERRAMLKAEIPHQPGALAHLLGVLAQDGHNLTKIEGRPATKPWTYLFFLEVEPPQPAGWLGRLHDGRLSDWRVDVVGRFTRILIGSPR